MNDQPAPVAATLARRLGSACYEIVLLAAILFAAGWVFAVIGQLLPTTFARPLLQIYLVAVCGMYFIYCWTHGGQTLPMKTWHIRVATLNGNDLTRRRAALRYALCLISVALGGLGFLWALFDRDGQFLHDRLGGTRIVKTG